MIKTATFILLFSSLMIAQISLAPAKGDRFYYYLTKNYDWETEYDGTSPIILHEYRDDSTVVFWIQRIDMPVGIFKLLRNYLAKQDDIGISGEGREYINGERELCTFDVYPDNNDRLIIMKAIKKFLGR